MLGWLTIGVETARIKAALMQLSKAVGAIFRAGGYEAAAALLKASGRDFFEHEDGTWTVSRATMAMPAYDFSVILLAKQPSTFLQVHGHDRYAGFNFMVGLPDGAGLDVDIIPSPRFGMAISWRARFLVSAIRADIAQAEAEQSPTARQAIRDIVG